MKGHRRGQAEAPSFEMAVMKAVRGAENSLDTLSRPVKASPRKTGLDNMDDIRLFTIIEALKSCISIDEIFSITKGRPLVFGKTQNLQNSRCNLIRRLRGRLPKGEEDGLHRRRHMAHNGRYESARTGRSYKMVAPAARNSTPRPRISTQHTTAERGGASSGVTGKR